MNQLNKYVQAIVDATGIHGETLGAVKLGIQIAMNDELFAQTMLRSDLEFYQGLFGEQRATLARLQGLEDRLLAWLDQHGATLPIVLAADYDQHLAEVIVEVLDQQRITIVTQTEALQAQKDAIARMRPPATATVGNGLAGLAMQATSILAAGLHNGAALTFTDPAIAADWPHGEALYVELHRLAQDGVGPSKARYNDQRAHGMPTANDVIATTGLRWFKLLEAAGLDLPTGPRKREPLEGAPDGDATFRG